MVIFYYNILFYYLIISQDLNIGSNPEINIYRYQEHSPYPSETFDLKIDNFLIDSNLYTSLSTPIPWDASGNTVETAIESLFPNNLVNVCKLINI